MNNIKVIIIGSTHHNTYSMVRCFAEYGILPYLILCGQSNSYLAKSNLIEDVDIVNSEEIAISLLINKYAKFRGSIVISCSDAVASLLDQSYEKLRDIFNFFNCGKTGQLTYLMNKLVQVEIAKKCGFKVPRSIKGFNGKVSSEELAFPVLVKPLESINGGKNIQVCHNQEDYDYTLKSLAEEKHIIVQEYICKEYEIVVLGVAIKGDVFIPGYILKYRDILGGTTYSKVLSIKSLSQNIKESCEKLVKEFNYDGLFGIELIKDKQDYYFIEINLRNDATTYSLAVAGVNLPLAYYQSYVGLDYSKTLNNDVNTIFSMVEFNDFIHVLKNTISPFKWYSQKRKSECLFCFCKSDKFVYCLQFMQFVKFLFVQVYTYVRKK